MTPLVLLAGCLGAGKTSFLRRLLPELVTRGVRPRVILNDYENASVDAASLADLSLTLVPISGSCMCCETQDQLLDALAVMPVRPGEAVLVETNGTTDTANLLALVTEAPGLESLSLPWQLTVVDAQRFGSHGWQNEIEREQIATATHLFLSRQDVVAAERLAVVGEAVRQIAPSAVFTTPAAFADDIAALGRRLAGIAHRAELTVDSTVTGTPAQGPMRPGAPHSPATHHFASFQMPLPKPVDAAAFQRFLDELPPEVLRAKGVVMLRDPPGEKRIFHKVDGNAEISPCRLADEEELTPIAIFVGVGAPMLAIRSKITRLLTV